MHNHRDIHTQTYQPLRGNTEVGTGPTTKQKKHTQSK